MLNVVFWLAFALIGVNAVTIGFFAFDKLQAQSRGWRVQETTLHVWTLIGGTPGAFWASRSFRHKTRKQPFRKIQFGIAVLQLVAIIYCLWNWEATLQVMKYLNSVLPRVIE